MQYMLIHTGAPDLAEAWNDDAWAALTSWLDETISSGVNIEGGPLGLDADATTVKVRDGQLIVTDGPYAETKEQIAGLRRDRVCQPGGSGGVGRQAPPLLDGGRSRCAPWPGVPRPCTCPSRARARPGT